MDSLTAARKGDEAAFLRLFDEHHPALYRFAYRLLGSAEDAEDCAQECFVELLRPGCSYSPGRTPLRTYLFGVVRNQALKRLRGRGAFVESEDLTASDSPEAVVLSGEIADAVTSALQRLPETQRTVLILSHYEQLPLNEIGIVTGLEIGAVKSRLQRARSALRTMLAAYAPGTETRR